MNYKQKYKKALEKAKLMIDNLRKGEDILAVSDLESMFPELKESEDERIRKELLEHCKNQAKPYIQTGNKCPQIQSWIAWLEKQGKQEQLYIRFGEIPTDEKSKIYQGEIEVGTENGVSVYPAFKTSEGDIILGLNLPITKTTLYTQQHLIEYDNRPCYLVKGNYVGKDTDGQPLINNISIIEKIGCYRAKEEKQGEQNYKIIKGKNYFCIKTHNYAGVEWIKGTKYYASDNYTLVNQGCECYCPEYSKEEHNNLFEEVKYDGYVENKMSANNVESTFKVGDWIVKNISKDVFLIKSINNGYYTLEDIKGNIISPCLPPYENESHLWTIEDAKPGDILVDNYGNVVIYQEPSTNLMYNSYCYGRTYIIKVGGSHPISNTYPATKEQRDTLFAKMHEAGYMWDSDSKQLLSLKAEPNNKKKPTWSEEDEGILVDCFNILHRSDYPIDKVTKIVNWLKSIRQRIGSKT